MMDIVVFGGTNFSLGFQLCGIRKTYPADAEDFAQTFEEKLMGDKTGIIIVENQYYTELSSRLKKRAENAISPVVIALSEEGAGASDIGKLIKRSLGIDLWRDNDE